MERFMELYQTVYKDMYRLAFYYLGNAQDAEDAVQDAALSAYENFGKLRKQEAFKAWIFRILTNQCYSILRGRKATKQPLTETETGYEQPLSPKTEAEELLVRLSDEERMIILLKVFGGYKEQEIAEILKEKYSTIRSKYHRALKKLKKEISLEVQQ